MNNNYAIIDNGGGWLVNFVVWDGNPQTWQPPAGTYAVLASTIDINNLPPNPASAVLYNAEEWLSKEGYGSTQLVTLLDLYAALSAAGKSSVKLNAVKSWTNSVLGEYVQNSQPKEDWGTAPYNFNETVVEAYQELGQ
jgi:hypothetical protein